MKRLLLCFVLVMMTVCAGAVPAKKGLTKVITLSDGSMVTAQLVGDEHGHYWLAADGKAYQAVGEKDVFQQVDARQIMTRAQEKRAKANSRRIKKMSQRRVGQVGNYEGEKKGLIILVNFSGDVMFKEDNDNALFQRIANEENFTYGNFYGSVYDYFYAQSEGKFQLTFDVVGPFTVSHNSAYYGGNNSRGDDLRPASMVGEAIQLADSQVDYSNYDWDGDGEVDQVYVIYAGKGEADGGASTTIWPHEWQLSSAAYYGDGPGMLTLDGVNIDTYACGAELDGFSGDIAGIGTMCHEFSHCLGYPDFYDTDYSGGQGMGSWDLMDGGSYNGDGYQPAGYTSYERWVAGWKEPTELVNSQTVTGMKSLQDGGESYIIYNKGNRNEYFLLENRQKTGWDASLPGNGLLILHVDYDATIWATNKPNDDPSHQRMTWIAADNEYQYYYYQGTKYFTDEGMVNDPYPYGSNNSFGRETTPAAQFYNKNTDDTYYMDASIEDITQNNDAFMTISFNFKGESNVATPVFTPAPGTFSEAQQVAITCETEGAYIYYTTDGSTPTSESSLYTEPISVEKTTVIKAVAVADNEESDVATGKYIIATASSKYFKLVTSTDEMVSGARYVIVCESKEKAASTTMTTTNNASYLKPSDVTYDDNSSIVTIGDDVEVFTAVKSGDEWTFINHEGQYLYATAAKKLAYSDDEKAWALVSGSNGIGIKYGSYGTMLYNVNSPRFSTYTSNPNVSMIVAHLFIETEDVEPETIEVTIGNAGYATLYYGEKNLTVPANIEVLTYSVTDDELTVSKNYLENEVIPAGTGAVLRGEPGTYVFTVTQERGESDMRNMLRGSDEDALTVADTTTSDSAESYFYKLAVENQVVGFYWANENGAPFVSRAHKAYLVVPIEVAQQAKMFSLDPKATAIESIVMTDGMNNLPVFDLQGQKVNGTNLPKGIYIIGGKKMVIK